MTNIARPESCKKILMPWPGGVVVGMIVFQFCYQAFIACLSLFLSLFSSHLSLLSLSNIDIKCPQNIKEQNNKTLDTFQIVSLSGSTKYNQESKQVNKLYVLLYRSMCALIWHQSFGMTCHFSISGKPPDTPGACWSGWTGKNIFTVNDACSF